MSNAKFMLTKLTVFINQVADGVDLQTLASQEIQLDPLSLVLRVHGFSPLPFLTGNHKPKL